MKNTRANWLPNRKLNLPWAVTALVVWTLVLLATPVSGWAGCIGWNCDGKSPCVGWNCDGKNPCTGMGCPGQGSGSSTGDNVQPLGINPSNLESSGREAPGTSGATKSSQPSAKASAKGALQKTKAGLPDVEGLTGESQSEGWGGSRNADTRTGQQRSSQEAVRDLPDLQGLTGGGQSQQQGWDDELKSDTRTIE